MTYTSGDSSTVASRRPNAPNCNNLLARIVVIGSIVLSVFGIILYSYDLYRHGGRQHLIGWFSSAGFVLLTFVISIRLIVLHLTHWYSPSIQKWLVRIIWMVPIYSIESWLALRFREHAIYIETVRECYEAYAIFSFLYFLIALLGEEAALIAILKEKSDERGQHVWPLRWCVKPWVLGPEFLHHSKLGVLQYVLMKNLMAALIFVLQIFDLYAEGRFRFDRGYVYICLVSNLSQLWALYCLVKFYHATKEELAPWAPVGKFMCVKVVVFFTWWQSLFVSFVAASLKITGSADTGGDWSRDQIVMGFQDWLICIEMFIASIAFSVSFTYNDYVPKHKVSCSIEAIHTILQRTYFAACFSHNADGSDSSLTHRMMRRGWRRAGPSYRHLYRALCRTISLETLGG